MPNSKQQAIAALLRRTGEAHHTAFLATDGDDPEWPMWYAAQLKDSLPALLGVELTQSRIVYELIRLAEEDHTDGRHWTEVYAEKLIKTYKPLS